MTDSKTKVRRIKATDDAPKESSAPRPKRQKREADKPQKRKFTAPAWLKAIGKPFAPIGRYFSGSWQELRLTKWPNRRATWSLALAVLMFSAFFALLIIAVDYGFEWLMKEVIL